MLVKNETYVLTNIYQKRLMNNLPLIEISEVKKYVVTTDNYQDVLTVADIDANSTSQASASVTSNGYSEPVRLNALFVILVLEGHVNLSLDYVPYKIVKNDFIIIIPTHIIQVAEASKNFKAKMMMIDRTFLDEMNTAKRSPSMTNYMLLRKHPRTVFEPGEAKVVEKAMELLQQKIRLRTHTFHKEVLQNGVVGFLLEIANIMVGKNDSLMRPTLSRKEEIMNQFLQLLTEHVREQHIVSFYADKLFITPQYLSLILKELTGKSANKWIDDALIIEAKLLLKSPQITVQQVADILCFSDQSTFGKFFKKHIGMSPLEFRKS